MIQAKTLADLDGVQHRFFTRRGGVSAGLYASLNCGYGSGDQPDNVRENRRRAAAAFDLAQTELLTLHQTHSTDVLVVADRRWTSPGAPKADAMVTDRPGVALGVLAADCAPVLLADPGAGVIGAAHAGWKGALAGIVEATIAAMERLGARRDGMRGAIGPCIGRDSYEVLTLAGVPTIATGHDTLAASDDFFSYRRNTLEGVRDYGRGLSAIALRG